MPDNYFSRLGLDGSKLSALIDAINNIDTVEDKEEEASTYAAEAAEANAKAAQAWIDAWAATQASFGATAASVEEAKEWIENWEKEGKPTDEAEKEEAKGFLKKLFGGFGKKK